MIQYLTVASCNATQRCQFEIGFNGKPCLHIGTARFSDPSLGSLAGTGITIYAVQLPGYTNFTVTLDSGDVSLPISRSILPPGSPALYNVSFYDLQQLPFSFHSFTLTLGNGPDGPSEILFDYAYINQTVPPPPPSPTSATTTPIISPTVPPPTTTHNPQYVSIVTPLANFIHLSCQALSSESLLELHSEA
jgi:hypothetical protein